MEIAISIGLSFLAAKPGPEHGHPPPILLVCLSELLFQGSLLMEGTEIKVTAPRPKERGFHGFLCRQIAIPI
ncbi:MAG: hypothetical protein STSR0001_10420 [Methanothrix sp.]